MIRTAGTARRKVKVSLPTSVLAGTASGCGRGLDEATERSAHSAVATKVIANARFTAFMQER
jgi:hypothetical protein